MSQNVDHLISKECDFVLHGEMKDPDVFKGETLPDPLMKGRGDWAVTMSLPESPASKWMCLTQIRRPDSLWEVERFQKVNDF
jgi:hypothetical protein